MNRTTLAAACWLGVCLSAAQALAGAPLPGTGEWKLEGDPADQMVAGIDRFLLRKLEESVAKRERHWKRDFTSPAAYEKSVEPNRQRLKKIIGAVDERTPFTGLEYVASTDQPALFGSGTNFDAFTVRWPVFRGVRGEGLLLIPQRKPAVADVVALPDADQTPEMLAGLTVGAKPANQFARRLAESGCRVLIPVLIDRSDEFSVLESGRGTNQPHREFVYRPAFEMGRHVLGYEVQKVLAGVDWFAQEAGSKERAIGVMGYGEGGLIALLAASLDVRIDSTCASGCFGTREQTWQEPIYRNVFGLLDQFGDAELASMVVPRKLVIEACRMPDVSGPPPARTGRAGAAPGELKTPPLAQVMDEATRAAKLVAGLKSPAAIEGVASDGGNGPFGSEPALTKFAKSLASDLEMAPIGETPTGLRAQFDPQVRLKRQLDELLADTQHLLREAEYAREKFWAKADRGSLEKFAASVEPYRDYFRDEVIGRFDDPKLPFNARTKQVYDEPKYLGYEVQLDVFPDVMAYGVLLVPKDIKPGERRPVVVCQHGLEGRPQDVADPAKDHPAYHRYACQLADRGYVVYAPQNPYIFKDRFRTLQRKANPLGKSLFSIIIPQHEQTTDWLASLPMVDPQRIAFYGLSYGGKTAMRVPALVPRYCLSICSADFNEWIWKNASLRSPYSYVGTMEYEIFEFDLGATFNYMEMAALIAPRPFMVERGHRDGVAPDHWVAYEFAKVKRLYVDLKIGDRTEIEFFDGPHTIHGVGTFDFLDRHLCR